MDSEAVRNSFAEQLSWSDSRLLSWAGAVVGVPKENPADSFVLHAPLELMARAALLALAPSDLRDPARERLVWLVASYEKAGPAVREPVPVSPRSVDHAVQSLLRAIDASDLDEIDRYAYWLVANVSASEIKAELGPALASSLAAAGHTSIGLHMMGRTPELNGSALRGALREVGRHPEWRVTTDGESEGDLPLLDALLSAPRLGMPGSDFIFPMVAHGAEAARRLLANVCSDSRTAAQALSRVAAWSMLQDTEERAPYGWTHTLTIPQAVMSLNLDPRLAVSIAGSQVIGFRSSMGTRTLNPELPMPEVEADVTSRLIAEALLHHDAHLVKYTLACLDAATSDPGMSDLYVAAAVHLLEWWEAQDNDGFFARSDHSR